MLIRKHFMSRRAFLKKSSVQVFVLINSNSLFKILDGKTTTQTDSSNVAYGSRIYGQGTYPGHQLYFPFMSKEEK